MYLNYRSIHPINPNRSSLNYQYRELLLIQKLLVSLAIISLLSALAAAALSVNEVQADKSSSNARRNEVTLNQGDSLRVEFKSKQPEPIQVVSFKLMTVDTSDPFKAYHVPLTVEVFEKNQLIGSESFTSDLGSGLKKIQVDVNNDPMIKGNYKIVIRFDNSEFNPDDNKVRVDLNTIKFNDGNVRMDLHGDIKVILGNV